ncbi:ROK family protein [Salinibacterium sp.]|uniref:ROK family protein n=1 Tax=Salinibacterium sp. TaxID=1915057 RepID=UPI00286A5D9F|nr:ROK family protein [Salinibacterium sp.]
MSVPDGLVPVLEVGGTHVTAALVSLFGGTPIVLDHFRFELRSSGPADDIIGQLASAASRLEVKDSRAWGIAIPGPFDYAAGIGRFEEVGKFESLNGFDLRAALIATIHATPRSVSFVNDADAFGLGESAGGAARHYDRAVCLTLGTGVGSAFIASGVPINDGPTVPRDGSAHVLEWNARPLEEAVSRRAIRARYAELTDEDLDVHDIAQRARLGDEAAAVVLNDAMRALGFAIAPWIDSFAAEILVVGGSISKSWDILERPLRVGITSARPRLAQLALAPAALPNDAPLIGAALSILEQ